MRDGIPRHYCSDTLIPPFFAQLFVLFCFDCYPFNVIDSFLGTATILNQ